MEEFLKFNIFDYIGLFGSLLITFVYFYGQHNKNFLDSYLYFIGNIFGSILIIISLFFSSFNISAFIIEILWIFISFYGIYLKYKEN
jgi:hypothetical protein